MTSAANDQSSINHYKKRVKFDVSYFGGETEENAFGCQPFKKFQRATIDFQANAALMQVFSALQQHSRYFRAIAPTLHTSIVGNAAELRRWEGEVRTRAQPALQTRFQTTGDATRENQFLISQLNFSARFL